MIISYSRNRTEWTDTERAAKQAPPRLAMFTFVCTECQHRFDDLVDRHEGQTPEQGKPCERCGHPSKMAPSLFKIEGSEFAGMFPYYSNTFKCKVESMAHHKKLCAQHGLEWAPDYDGRDETREADKKAAEEDAIVADYHDQLENSPAYAKFRDLRSKGFFDPTPEEQAQMKEAFEMSQRAHLAALQPAGGKVAS